MLEVARSGRTANPYLARIFRAQKINQAMGGLAVMPWQVDGIDDDWLEVFRALADELPGFIEMVKSQQNAQSGWLNRQGYRSYLKGK